MDKEIRDRKVIRDNQKKTDFQTVFLSEHRKKVMKELEKFCFYNTITTVDRPSDSHLAYFNEGRRSVILYIKKLIKEKE